MWDTRICWPCRFPRMLRVTDRWLLALRWLVTLLLLAGLAWQLDSSAVMTAVASTSGWLFVPAFLLVLLQVAVSAWRWKYTAGRLNLSLPFRLAFREYYLATFLNQLLPGGVVGDINRAWRQGLHTGERLAALHSVMIERLSGQVALAIAALAGGLILLPGLAPLNETKGVLSTLAVISAGVLMLTALFRHRLPTYVRILHRDLERALFRWPALLIQLTSSAAVVAAYLGVFVLLAAGQDNWAGTGSPMMLLLLCPVLLLAMVVPVTIAGWGVREGAAAVLWTLAGLPAEQGVALSVGYGIVNLLCSLPGGLALIAGPDQSPQKNPDQTAYRTPD